MTVMLLALALSGIAGPEGERSEGFTIQWEDASPTKPWLREVRVVPTGGLAARVMPLEPSRGLPNGVRVLVTGNQDTPEGAVRVELADDYGFTLSTKLLRGEPFVWLKDLGVFACAEGDFASKQPELDALAAKVDAARRQPFRSTSERYFEFTGYPEDRSDKDDRAYEFAYHTPRPVSPRTHEALAILAEPDYEYFAARVPDVRHRRMYLGWPNVCQEFCVLSNGCIGVCSRSALGTGHPAAQDFTVHVGTGDPPEFREHGDPTVTQSLEDGYHIIVHTKWASGGSSVETTTLAYPLAGEEVRTGNEPIAAFVRIVGPAKSPLGLRIRPEILERRAKNPLRHLSESRVESGLVWAGTRIVLGFDGATATLAEATDNEVLVKLEPQAQQVLLVVPYVRVPEALVRAALDLGFEAALSRTKRFWDAALGKGTLIDVPDQMVINQYRTLYPRTLVTGDLDDEGHYVLKTSPHRYDAVWLHVTAYGIEGLARRGHFTEARQYLEAALAWQGSQPAEASEVYTSWDGFFNAPKRYTAILWLNFHGWLQWAAARYFLYSDDRAWLNQCLPALIKSLEWTASQRRLTMRDNPDGSRPINYGWLPSGRVTDGSRGTSTFTDCVNWMGFNELVTLLERIGHPRAAEFRAEAENYRRCILRGLRLAARQREPVRLNDGTYVPYVPGYLESTGHEEDVWYAGVVDGALVGIPDTAVIPPGDPLEDWVLSNLEDNLFVIAPNLADEGYFVGHGCGYIRRDEPEAAVYTFYSLLATQMARQTLTTFEHRASGAGRAYDLAPWALGYYTRILAGMLCYDEGDEIMYCRATPRAWLDPGKQIRIEHLQTRFGPTSFILSAEDDRIIGRIEMPTRHPPKLSRLRLRVNGNITSVRLNGQVADFDRHTQTVVLPAAANRVEVEATVERGGTTGSRAR